jgi:hypothetical protein
MAHPSDERMAGLVEQIKQSPGLVGELPGAERAIVREALAGQSVHAIAHDRGISEEAVWTVLGDAARLASGQEPAQRVETGGLGADTDPGVTGGYEELDYGEAGVEPPPPLPEPGEPLPGAPSPSGDERPNGAR